MWKRSYKTVFWCSELKQQIKLTIRTINHSIKQIPEDRRGVILSRVNEVMNDHHKNLEDEVQLRNFFQELQFNLNFIKLSNPHLDFNPPAEEKQQESQNPENLAKEKKAESPTKQPFQVGLEGFSEEKVKEYEKFSKEARQEVQFSNWFEGNSDPQQLKKHKELLQRQHFSGQFWKGKQKPQLMAKSMLLSKMAENETPKEPPKKDQVISDSEVQYEQGNDFWEKVKR